MAQAAIRKTSRIRRLWPSRDLRPPPAPPCQPDRIALAPRPAAPDENPSLRGLTAHELIAMARAARARSREAGDA